MNHVEGGTEAASRVLLRSALVIGFSGGLFAGMSESPVGSALVAAILGLVGASGIWTLLATSKKEKPPTSDSGPDQRTNTSEADAIERALPWLQIELAARTVARICLSAILGAVLGIGLRDGWLLPTLAKKEEPKLMDISKAGSKLERKQQLKLLILQSELRSLGIDDDQNNQFLSSFIAAAAAENGLSLAEGKSLGEEDLKHLKGDLNQAKKAVEVAPRVRILVAPIER